MSQWKNVGAIVALSITAALAGTGCLAQSADDEAMNEPEATAVDQESDQGAVGEATEACCAGGGWCDLAALGTAIPGLGFGGFGPLFGACGGCFPVGGCGLGLGCGVGLGGCGGCGVGCGGCGVGLGGCGGGW